MRGRRAQNDLLIMGRRRDFLDAKRGYSDADCGGARVIRTFLAADCVFFGTFYAEKFRKFGKKVIALNESDDYHNKFSCEA